LATRKGWIASMNVWYGYGITRRDGAEVVLRFYLNLTWRRSDQSALNRSGWSGSTQVFWTYLCIRVHSGPGPAYLRFSQPPLLSPGIACLSRSPCPLTVVSSSLCESAAAANKRLEVRGTSSRAPVHPHNLSCLQILEPGAWRRKAKAKRRLAGWWRRAHGVSDG
jgi:hypothetical protein